MIIKDNNTIFDFKVQLTPNNDGLGSGDYWCNVDFVLKNDEINLKDNNYPISKKELEDLINKAEELLKKTTNYKEKIVFIKNFFSITLINNRSKIIEIKLISINNTRKNYTIKIVDEEIKEYLNKLKTNNS